jgi:spore coat polysaccharide biosynthesis protein SpsF (cytidylyltransferase family)
MSLEKFDIIIQARIGSTRLKGKILKTHKGLSPLKVLIKRLHNCKNVRKIIICTTHKKEDNAVIKFCKNQNINFYRGSINNVLSRYFFSARKFKSKNIIRITSDCPFVDYRIINKMTDKFAKLNIDYYANTYPLPTNYPDGMDIEIFSFKTLKKTFCNASLPSEKEHVTPYIFKSKKFKIKKKILKTDLSKFRFTIDYHNDFILFKKIIDQFKKNIYKLSMNDLIKFVLKNPNLIKYQKKIKRNEGWATALKKDEKYL